MGDPFDEFWEVYPINRMKEYAVKAWEELMDMEVDPDEIIAGLKRHMAAYPDLVEGVGFKKFPVATTWLKYRGWERF
tara:strand:+ start:4987 stop:5217 length:231 start_codon:yes stop_codon:yes gene_type:complete